MNSVEALLALADHLAIVSANLRSPGGCDVDFNAEIEQINAAIVELRAYQELINGTATVLTKSRKHAQMMYRVSFEWLQHNDHMLADEIKARRDKVLAEDPKAAENLALDEFLQVFRHWKGEAAQLRAMSALGGARVWQVYGAGLRHICDCNSVDSAEVVVKALNEAYPAPSAGSPDSK